MVGYSPDICSCKLPERRPTRVNRRLPPERLTLDLGRGDVPLAALLGTDPRQGWGTNGHTHTLHTKSKARCAEEPTQSHP